MRVWLFYFCVNFLSIFMKDKVKIGLLGTGSINKTHCIALQKVSNAVPFAVASRDINRAKSFAEAFHIERFFGSYEELIEQPDIDAVLISLPNNMHADLAIKAAKNGKHIICEKPLCLTLEEADLMIVESEKQGVLLCYAEQLCFAPKLLRMKEICDGGGIGEIYMVKQTEKHSGPHSTWFYNPILAGGGSLIDLGCHSIEFCRWLLGKPEAKSVYADLKTYLHNDKTILDDHCVLVIEFENNKIAMIECSWALKGGMKITVEAYGTEGVIYADLFESGIRAFMGKILDKYSNPGWGIINYEHIWNNGYPQELSHFAECILSGKKPQESGEDGKKVLEIMLAAYYSAKIGEKVFIPLHPPKGLSN